MQIADRNISPQPSVKDDTVNREGRADKSCLGCWILLAILVVSVVGVYGWFWYPRTIEVPSPDGRFTVKATWNWLTGERVKITRENSGETYVVDQSRYGPFPLDDHWNERRQIRWDPGGAGLVYAYAAMSMDNLVEGVELQIFEVHPGAPFARGVLPSEAEWAGPSVVEPRAPFVRRVLPFEAEWAGPILVSLGMKEIQERSPTGRFTARIDGWPHSEVTVDIVDHRSGTTHTAYYGYAGSGPDNEWHREPQIVWAAADAGFLYVYECWSRTEWFADERMEGRRVMAFETMPEPPFAQEVSVDEAAWAEPILISLELKYN